jgi:hypothetical protein
MELDAALVRGRGAREAKEEQEAGADPAIVASHPNLKARS